jgi:hypothetical protein
MRIGGVELTRSDYDDFITQIQSRTAKFCWNLRDRRSRWSVMYRGIMIDVMFGHQRGRPRILTTYGPTPPEEVAPVAQIIVNEIPQEAA